VARKFDPAAMLKDRGSVTKSSGDEELAPERHIDVVPERHDDIASERQMPKMTYRSVHLNLTPELRTWLKAKGRSLPEGLSMSDVCRLALNRLREQVPDDVELVELLTRQAHEEARTLTGRRFRGMPSGQP
jgi:hypothetical protein